jgi:hypothetical protein
MAMTASCLACSAGLTPAEYCTLNPGTEGCKPLQSAVSSENKLQESNDNDNDNDNAKFSSSKSSKGDKSDRGGKGKGKKLGKEGKLETELCSGCCPKDANCFAADPPCCAANVGALAGVEGFKQRDFGSNGNLLGLHLNSERVGMLFGIVGTIVGVGCWIQFQRSGAKTALAETQPLVSDLAHE